MVLSHICCSLSIKNLIYRIMYVEFNLLNTIMYRSEQTLRSACTL